MLSSLDHERDRGVAMLEGATTLDELEAAQVEVIGRKSRFSTIQRSLGSLAPEDRKRVGHAANAARAALQGALAARREILEHLAEDALLDADRLDMTLPGRRPRIGSLHPLTIVEREAVDVFTSLGFRVAEGPEVEDDWHNFQALNIPPDHPARTMKDSLYVDVPGHPELLLRTETSAVQIRTMQAQPPPIFVVAPGRVYRRETSDPTHLPVFHQIEGLAVDEGITFADLKGTLEVFVKAMFGERRRIRLGPAYFPFVEPGCEVGVSCFRCDGVGLPGVRDRLDRAARSRHGASGRARELRIRPGAIHRVRVRARHRTGRDAPLRSSRHPRAGRRRRPAARAVPGGRVKVVWSWLREFCPTEHSAADLAERLTLHGVKVEEVVRPWDGVEGVVVARVAKVDDHPNSQKLTVVTVDDGTGEHVVCAGVRNYEVGDLVPWARPGSRVPLLAEPLAPRDLGGVVSNGMLCSPRELAIADVHEGILVLNDEPVSPGDDVRIAFGLDDEVLDIEVEPNRPDFLSVLGVAREVSALTGTPLVASEPSLHESGERASEVASVRIDAFDGCPRYVARVIRGVGAGSTPIRAQARLVGVRHASDLAGRRRNELRDAGARTAPARVRPASARRAGHRRPSCR